MAVTIKDIAREAACSIATVSRALNNRYGTDPRTLERIQRIAREMGYQPNQIAKSLVSRVTKTIGIILPDLANPFFSTLLSHVRTAVDQAGYSLIICTSEWDQKKENKELSLLVERRCDGIFLYPAASFDDGRLKTVRVPLIIFSEREISQSNVSFVGVDNDFSGVLATEHLLACGYRRPAFIGGVTTSVSNQMRRRSFLRILKQAGIEIPKAFVTNGRYSIEHGQKRVQKLLQLPKDERPDALFCANDLLALGAMEAVTHAGLRLGTDIGVVGVDNVTYAALPQIRLTTVDIPLEELAAKGMELLLALLQAEGENKQEDTPAVPPTSTLLRPSLVVRDTTRRCGPGEDQKKEKTVLRRKYA